ncbi:MAG: hypothetical protein JXR66_08650 [Bacteroidales bacterium]|nr:hypothetical protein [Bacteroidales bacterium]
MAAKKSYIHSVILILVVLIFGSVACTPGSCFEETNALVKSSFYSDTSGLMAAPDSVSIYGGDNDTNLIYNKSRKPDRVLLPLDASATECSFVIEINGITDTITFTYSSYPHLVSKECGYTYFYTIEDPLFTGNIIDTITLTKNTITTLAEENIRIYY